MRKLAMLVVVVAAAMVGCVTTGYNVNYGAANVRGITPNSGFKATQVTVENDKGQVVERRIYVYNNKGIPAGYFVMDGEGKVFVRLIGKPLRDKLAPKPKATPKVVPKPNGGKVNGH